MCLPAEHSPAPENKDYLDQAEKYLKEFDYPASANYLRKETERQLKKLLPPNKTVTVDVKDGEATKPLQLEDLLINFKANYIQFYPDFTPFKKL